MERYGIAGTFFSPKANGPSEFGGYFSRCDSKEVSKKEGFRIIGALTDMFGNSDLEGLITETPARLNFSKLHYSMESVETSGAPEEASVLDCQFDFKFKIHKGGVCKGVWIGEYDFWADGSKRWSDKANCTTFLIEEPFKVLLQVPVQGNKQTTQKYSDIVIPTEGSFMNVDSKEYTRRAQSIGEVNKGILANCHDVSLKIFPYSSNSAIQGFNEIHLLWIPHRKRWVALSRTAPVGRDESWDGPWGLDPFCCEKILEAYKVSAEKISLDGVLSTPPDELERIASKE